MYKVDLHTHSIASPDGSLGLEDYRRTLAGHVLDYIAITDHNTIDFALSAQAALGPQIIIGEEITTTEGEVIGLFLQEAVPPGLGLADAVARIHGQGGLVYVPHPFETVRSGVSLAALDGITKAVDIIEMYNGRALFQKRGSLASAWAADHHVAGAASSDAHGVYGWGNTYSIIDRPPDVRTLQRALQAARYHCGTVGLRGVLYPKYNRLRKVFSNA